MDSYIDVTIVFMGNNIIHNDINKFASISHESNIKTIIK